MPANFKRCFTGERKRSAGHFPNPDNTDAEKERGREREGEKVTREYVQRGKEYISNCFCSLGCSCLQKGRTHDKLNKYFKLVSHARMHAPTHAHSHSHLSSEIEITRKILV